MKKYIFLLAIITSFTFGIVHEVAASEEFIAITDETSIKNDLNFLEIDYSKIVSGEDADIRIGNALPLDKIPVGTIIHNIEMYAGHGGQLVRSAGASAQILGREGKYVIIRLTSGEVRKLLGNCRATIGEIGNADHMNVNIGKAGRKRHMGINPTVRGSVMNPNDHPHGGGEGRTPVGRKAPLTPWGKIALGLKTRKTKKKSNDLIVRRRNG